MEKLSPLARAHLAFRQYRDHAGAPFVTSNLSHIDPSQQDHWLTRGNAHYPDFLHSDKT